MDQYDVLIIGNDIGALVTALFLARKMRKVLVLSDNIYAQSKENVVLTDSQGNQFTFINHFNDSVPGLQKLAIMNRFLHLCGLDNDIQSEQSHHDMMIKRDNSIISRPNHYEDLLVYFVRYYPKQRDRIHRFFRDLKRHYDNYLEQQNNMMANRGYTISSLMIEWGDYSLEDLLRKYFTDDNLVKEFLMTSSIIGLDSSEISCYNFFIKFLSIIYTGEYYLKHNQQDLQKLLITKLTAINRNIIKNKRVRSIVLDEDKTILKVVDEDANEYYAKHYVVSESPNTFYPMYFPDMPDEINDVLRYYPQIDTRKKIQSVYLGLSIKPELIGIDNLNYFFECDDKDEVKLVRLFNEKIFNPESCLNKFGSLVLDIVYDGDKSIGIDDIIQRFEEVFPKLGKAISTYKFGKPRAYLSMLSQTEVRKSLTIDDQIAIETLSRQQMFDNLYLIGDWLRPESGLFGLFQAGIIYGDAIEEKLYYGDDDDEFFYLSNDEIMMMLRHNYGKKLLGRTEKHINFHIGKSNYFIRTKHKNITIHQGEYFSPDIDIYTTNDKLSSLLLKKASFETVLKSGGFKYRGKESDLNEIVEAFKLDDYQEEETIFQPKSEIYFLGVKFLFVYLFIWGIMSFLSNFINMIWLAPFAFIISMIVTYVKYNKYRDIAWFEYLFNALLLITILMAAIWPAFNKLRSDDPYLGAMALIFLVSWIINKPIVYDFHKYDYKRDYAQSSLFKVINNGLTLVWSVLFLSILAFTYVTSERYISALYNLLFLGFFMTYFYPVLYVRGNIKR